MRRSLAVALVALALLAGGLAAGTAAARVPAAAPAPTVVGNISGPAYVGTSSTGTYYINGTGGPAIGANGTVVGNLSWKASVAGDNLTGVALSPNSSTLTVGHPSRTTLTVSNVTQTLTISVEVFSTYQTENASANFTYTVHVVTPYVVRATLRDISPTPVGPFSVTVDLDGRSVGKVNVSLIAPNGSYNLSFAYATGGLSTGEHTFTISLGNESGLVRFSNGAVQYSQSFYVVGPAPDYALWIVIGVVVFFGVLFIFATRVAARRRPSARK